MLTDNYTPIIFSSKLIWVDWSTPKLGVISENQKVSLIKVLLLVLYSSMKKKSIKINSDEKIIGI